MTFRNQKVFTPITTVMQEMKNINFESNITSSIFNERILVILKSSKQPSYIPSYHTNITSKLNECINKLTLPYFNFFCQLFHIPFFYNIFDQRFFCFCKKLFQLVHKKVIKIKKWLALNLPLTSLFPMFSKTSIW